MTALSYLATDNAADFSKRTLRIFLLDKFTDFSRVNNVATDLSLHWILSLELTVTHHRKRFHDQSGMTGWCHAWPVWPQIKNETVTEQNKNIIYCHPSSHYLGALKREYKPVIIKFSFISENNKINLQFLECNIQMICYVEKSLYNHSFWKDMNIIIQVCSYQDTKGVQTINVILMILQKDG